MQLSPASGSPHHPEQHLSSSIMFTSSLFRTYTIVGSSYEGHLFEEEELYSDPRTTLFLISMSKVETLTSELFILLQTRSLLC